jgi:threonine aldolase
MFDLREVQSVISDDSDDHIAATRLLCLENTHNFCGGAVLSIAQVEALATLAHRHNMMVHMDGARVFNAATALGISARELVDGVDSVMFCLSKGLSAPVGSLVAGSHAFIKRLHRVRKLLGGGMRQAGIFAAAGVVALQEMVERLAEDHENSKLLAHGLGDFPQIEIQPERVVTNIVIFSLRDPDGQAPGKTHTEAFLRACKAQGILMAMISDEKIRAVTHHGIEAEDIKTALAAIRRVLIEMPPGV